MKTGGAGSSIMDREFILNKIDEIRKTVKGNLPNIYLFHGNLSDDEMNQLYNQPRIKAMVNLTKGEGFGRPLLEFSAIDKPVITTGWSGHIDFLEPTLSVLLPGQLENVHQSAVVENMILPESQWFTVDYVQASKAMRDVFKNYKEYSLKAERQGKFSRDKFSFDKMRDLLGTYLERAESTIPKPIEIKLPELADLK